MKVLRAVCLATAVLLLVGGMAQAGAKIKINDDSSIDLGFRLQTLAINSDTDLDGNGTFESYQDIKVRRGRIRLKGIVNEHVSIFLQTEIGGGANGSGASVRLIDAFMTLKKNNWLQFNMGLLMAPASRQNLTSSGALLAIDRPGITYKTLTWGTRALSTFSNRTFSDSDAGLRNSLGVRDPGFTLFGSGDAGENSHVKYYIGAYNGIQAQGYDSERIAGRVQVNFGDPEPGYFNLATYLGKKKTIGIGLSFDKQSDVAPATILAKAAGPTIDYQLISADFFAEQPAGDGAVTVEGAWRKLDLDDDISFINSQGDGFYIQAGYFVNNWQPWIEYETWTSDASNNLGSFDSYRIGVSYFLRGHNANVKLGYESFNSDVAISGTTEDSIKSLVFGMYVTY